MEVKFIKELIKLLERYPEVDIGKVILEAITTEYVKSSESLGTCLYFIKNGNICDKLENILDNKTNGRD